MVALWSKSSSVPLGTICMMESHVLKNILHQLSPTRLSFYRCILFGKPKLSILATVFIINRVPRISTTAAVAVIRQLIFVKQLLLLVPKKPLTRPSNGVWLYRGDRDMISLSERNFRLSSSSLWIAKQHAATCTAKLIIGQSARTEKT